MKKSFKYLCLALLLAAFLSPVAEASGGHRRGHGWGHGHHRYYDDGGWHRHRHHRHWRKRYRYDRDYYGGYYSPPYYGPRYYPSPPPVVTLPIPLPPLLPLPPLPGFRH